MSFSWFLRRGTDQAMDMGGTHTLEGRSGPYKCGLRCVTQGDCYFLNIELVKADTHELYTLYESGERLGREAKLRRFKWFKTKEEAIKEFEEVFNFWTGNEWKEKAHFVKKPGLYYLEELDYAEIAQVNEKLEELQDRRTCNMEIAKLAERVKRYDDMLPAVKEIIKIMKSTKTEGSKKISMMKTEEVADLEKGDPLMHSRMSHDENRLFCDAFRNIIAERRFSYQAVSIYQFKHKPNEREEAIAKDYLKKIAEEVKDICSIVLDLLETLLIPDSANHDENLVLFMRMKADYYRYQTEVTEGEELENLMCKTIAAYNSVYVVSRAKLPPCHPLRLTVVLNLTNFYSDIYGSPYKAYDLASKTVEEVLTSISSLDDESNKEGLAVLMMIRENMTLWGSSVEFPEEEGVEECPEEFAAMFALEVRESLPEETYQGRYHLILPSSNTTDEP